MFLQMQWCVAKPSSEQAALNDNIQYACNNLADCSMIQPGGACYLPNNLINHASVVMNLYFQSRRREQWNCVFGGTGLRVITDPSKSPRACVYIMLYSRNNLRFLVQKLAPTSQIYGQVIQNYLVGLIAGYGSCSYNDIGGQV